MSTPPHPSPLTIVCLCGGTRGDTQPVLAIALALRKQSCCCVLIGPPEQREFIEAMGFEYHPFPHNMRQWMQQDEELQEACLRGDVSAALERTGRVVSSCLGAHPEVVRQVVEGQRGRVHGVLGSSMEWLTAAVMGEALGVPAIGMWMQPTYPSSEVYPVMVDPAVESLPREPSAIQELHLQVLGGWFASWSASLNEMCARVGVHEWSEHTLLQHIRGERPNFMAVHAFSPAVFPAGPPSDVPVHAHGSGFLFVEHTDDPSGRHVAFDPLLEGFLARGEAPVYLGWGSMCMSMKDAAQYTATLVRALMASRRRGILLRGWQELDTCLLTEPALCAYAQANVLTVESIAHELLFPRCSAVLVHGGMGTTAQAMRSGRPILVSPWSFDQMWMAESVQAKGLGKRVSPLPVLSSEELAAAITCVLDDAAIAARCQEMRARLLQERGNEAAAERVLSFVRARAVAKPTG
eukprot:TRINITY_DN933_c1_g2_i1.p1 TRINITY_DN933_c1_g2~~TRINITY_DN933_c1_g2_i1.p1  ORF type:complete len:496 (-),score=141.63 TRINITY_DN933_c1_g2_i1:24-1418(-)